MTNEQLAILLNQLHTDLSAALDSARQAIALTRPTKTERRHVPQLQEGSLLPNCFGGCDVESHYEEFEQPDPVAELAPVEAALDRLSDHSVLLTRRPSSD